MTPEEFAKELNGKKIKVTTKIGTAMNKVCNTIKNTAQTEMTNTTVNNGVSYGKRGHHPSLPDNYPAVDMGKLRDSITYKVRFNTEVAEGTIGSPKKYAGYLENGTSKMRPRKWLKPSIEKNNDFIKKTLSEVFDD